MSHEERRGNARREYIQVLMVIEERESASATTRPALLLRACLRLLGSPVLDPLLLLGEPEPSPCMDEQYLLELR